MFLVLFSWFQFHKGTIKTLFLGKFFSSWLVFQFHKGTIKTSLLLQMQTTIPYFNSIKVRLKREVSEFVYFAIIFQFHKGTIKTFLICCI